MRAKLLKRLPKRARRPRLLTLLRANAWQAEGSPERTLAFREGSFVESDGTSVKLAAFEVKDAGEAEGQRYLDIDIMREATPTRPRPRSSSMKERGVLGRP